MNEKEIKEFYDDTTFPGLYSSEDIIDPGDYLIYLRYIDFIKDNNIKTMLDVGCGTGFITNILAFHCPEVTITAIDFSNAIQHGIAISNELELGNIMWRQENFFDYRNIIKFDCVLSNGSIHHMPRFNEAVEKLKDHSDKFIVVGVYNKYGKWAQRKFCQKYITPIFKKDQCRVPFELSFTNKEFLSYFKDWTKIKSYPSFFIDFFSLFRGQYGGFSLYYFGK